MQWVRMTENHFLGRFEEMYVIDTSTCTPKVHAAVMWLFQTDVANRCVVFTNKNKPEVLSAGSDRTIHDLDFFGSLEIALLKLPKTARFFWTRRVYDVTHWSVIPYSNNIHIKLVKG